MADEASKTPGGPAEQKRSPDQFIKEYYELVAKHDFDFAGYPVFINDEKLGFKVAVQIVPVDMKLRELNQSFITKS